MGNNKPTKQRPKAFMPGAPMGRPAKDNAGEWMPLVDWMEIYPGNRSQDRHGQFGLFDSPTGIQLKLEEAIASEPLLIADKEWEESGLMLPLSAWRDNGLYHMLYRTEGTAYAVSNDAYHWTRPEMNLVEFNGSTNNNLVSEYTVGPVVDDPQAPTQERFKGMMEEVGMFDPVTGKEIPGEEGLERMRAQSYATQTYEGPGVDLSGVIRGFTSPDRIHWKRIDKPIADMPSDGTGANPMYEPETNTYFAYIRVHGLPPQELAGLAGGSPEMYPGRRSVGLARTKDFFNWPPPKLVLFPDPQDAPDISFYGGFYFPYPDRKDLHCMLVHVFHQITGTVDSQIAFSHDGIIWYRPEHRAIIPTGPMGSGFEGGLYSQGGLLELPDGYWGIPFCGKTGQHNGFHHDGTESPSPAQLRWARWKPHRFCGVESDAEGRFTISTVKRRKKELRLNFRCGSGGWVKVEVRSTVPFRKFPDGEGAPGFTFEECDWLTGDSTDKIVTWKGRSDISTIGETVSIRLKLFHAKIFAYQV